MTEYYIKKKEKTQRLSLTKKKRKMSYHPLAGPAPTPSPSL